LLPPDLDSFLRLADRLTIAPVGRPEKVLMVLLKAQHRSWSGMLQMLHIEMKIQLVGGHLIEESGVTDIGPSYSGVKRLMRL
jgi:hypothetical protein